MTANEIAFFIGLFGSIHCVGMCGPLAFAVPVQNSSYALIIWDKVVYNLGRIISYSTIGLIAGLIGRQLWLSGLQQGISIFSGLLIILAALSRFIKYPLTKGRFFSRLLSPFYKLMSFAIKNRAGHLIVGVLNGFLPGSSNGVVLSPADKKSI